MNRDQRLANTRCPGCHRLVDAATGIKLGTEPKAGDLTVCVYCFVIARFRAHGDGLKLELVSENTFIELPLEVRAKLKRVQQVLRGAAL